MAKTDLTVKLENDIYKETYKMGIYGCFEVTIGTGSEGNKNGRVDFLTFQPKTNIWRFYEIKVSKADFHSKAIHTFLGNYNYYVMTSELYEEVKDEIPNHIGVYCGRTLVKRPKKQELGIDEHILKNSMIRSLHREYDKCKDSESFNKMKYLKQKINKLENNIKTEQRNYMEYKKMVREYMKNVSNQYNIPYQDLRKLLVTTMSEEY